MKRFDYDMMIEVAEKRIEMEPGFVNPNLVHIGGKTWELVIEDYSILWIHKETVLRATPYWADTEDIVLYGDEERPANIFCEFSTTEDCNPLSMFEIPFCRFFDDDDQFWTHYIQEMSDFLSCIAKV